jgi:asparagine synthase (glutamine-hydrolysing)
MPGISFICDSTGGGLRRDPAVIRGALDSLCHDERYGRHEWLNDRNHFLGYTAYREYPIAAYEVGGVTIYWEGRLYGENASADSTTLRELADLAFAPDGEAQTRAGDWLARADGDFVAILVDKKIGDVFIINDLFGRLPLYSCRTAGELIVSRELRFIRQLLERSRLDRMAIAQHLLIGYPLGKRTLLENVDRVPAATCIRVAGARREIRIDRLHRFNCEDKADAGASLKDNARELAALFSRSCAARALPDARNVISLSGGFDSRAIAAGFHKIQVPFRSATFLDPGRKAEHDVPVAQKIAALFHSDWKFLSLEAADAQAVLKLLRMKNGMNPLYMSFLLAFLEEIRRSWGANVVFFSGELGDRILPDRRPPRHIATVEDVVDYLITHDPKFPLDTVCALTGIEPGEIIAELRHHVDSFPEQDPAQKYIHFTTHERVFKWLCEGEDRNRCYFWTATPYSGRDFFHFAMRCPDEQKSYYALYREFLLELSPAAALIDHAGTGAAVTTDRFKTLRKTLEFLQDSPEIRKRMETVVGPSQGFVHDALTVAYLRRQTSDAGAIFEYLSAPALKTIAENPKNYTKEAIDLLFTITATVEETLTGRSVLEQEIGFIQGGKSQGPCATRS